MLISRLSLSLARVNLTGANLSDSGLMSATLWRANLTGANLSRASLMSTDFSQADLTGANLSRASLMSADLSLAKLAYANLTEAVCGNTVFIANNFSHADLTRVGLLGATLTRANFAGAKLQEAVLSSVSVVGADFSHADLSRASLVNADLTGADLCDAKLSGTHLHWARLSGAKLRGAKLSCANLQGANLIGSVLDAADLTDANLWETQRSGWSIRNVICHRAFWDREGKKANNYQEGEFERAFAEKPQIRLDYPNGMQRIDVVMLPIMVERMQADHPGSELHIRSIQDEGHGAVVVITVDAPSDRNAEVFRQEVEQQLRHEVSYLQGQRDFLMPMFQELISMTKNQISIGQITGPTTIKGTQHVGAVNYTTNDLSAIREHVNALLRDRDQWPNNLTAEKATQFEQKLEELSEELAKANPNKSAIHAGLVWMKDVLTSAAGTAAYGGLLASLLAFA